MSSALPPQAKAGSSAQTLTAAFADDDRIHFSTETKTWRFEGEDGSELEYDAVKGKWLPVVDEDLLKSQQAAYSVSGVDEETPAAPVLARVNKKRKEQVDYTSTQPDVGHSTKRGRNDKHHATETNTSAPVPPRSKNTAVYVTGLPIDTEFDELVERFAKCGVIEEDDEGESKVKMYAREDGSFSGEALVVYFKEDSVLLAMHLLDDAEFRLGDSSTVIRVQKAQFGHKNTSSDSGEAKPRKVVDKKKATRRIGKMQKKLAEWDDEDGFGPLIAHEESTKDPHKDSRVVVLKHMFTLKELEEDASLLLDLKEDVRDECATLGDVTNVVLYDKEPEGVMTVKFRDSVSAKACVLKMNGRFFAGRRIEASLYTGKHRFRRSGASDDLEGQGEEAEKKRLDNFADWLMRQED